MQFFAAGLNRTFMELKFNSPEQDTIVFTSLNRTFMELKSRCRGLSISVDMGLNRTFMELKSWNMFTWNTET